MLRRGAMMAAVAAGLSLLFGSMIGGAVRSSQTVRMPNPNEAPRNNLPGSPLPGTSHGHTHKHRGTHGPGTPRTRRPSTAVPRTLGVGPAQFAGRGPRDGLRRGLRQPQPVVPGRRRAHRAAGPPRQQAPATSAGPSSSGGAGAARPRAAPPEVAGPVPAADRRAARWAGCWADRRGRAPHR
ncbi:hypothetical protein NKH77_24205 [Streptomyces sp. M19]